MWICEKRSRIIMMIQNKFQGLVLKFCGFKFLWCHWFFHLYFGPFPCFVFLSQTFDLSSFWFVRVFLFCLPFLFSQTFGLSKCSYFVFNFCSFKLLVCLGFLFCLQFLVIKDFDPTLLCFMFCYMVMIINFWLFQVFFSPQQV